MTQAGVGSETKKRRAWLAALLSGFSPGLGHVYIGCWREAALAASISLCVLILGAVTMGLWPYGYAVAVAIAATIPLANAIAAFVAARGRSSVSRKSAPRFWMYWAYCAAALFVFVGAANALVAFGPYRVFHIPSGAMEPTIRVGDIVVVRRAGDARKRAMPVGAVVVFSSDWENRRKDYIKRIVGKGADRIVLRLGVLELNDAPVRQDMVGDYTVSMNENELTAIRFEERFGSENPHSILDAFPETGQLDNLGPYHVPEGHYFMLGDNRDLSSDSRITNQMGYVPVSAVLGAAVYVGWSKNAARIGARIK